MKIPKRDNGLPGVFSEDDLLKLELAVAHRADEIWKTEGQGRGSDLEFWLRAEREVITHHCFEALSGT